MRLTPSVASIAAGSMPPSSRIVGNRSTALTSALTWRFGKPHRLRRRGVHPDPALVHGRLGLGPRIGAATTGPSVPLSPRKITVVLVRSNSLQQASNLGVQCLHLQSFAVVRACPKSQHLRGIEAAHGSLTFALVRDKPLNCGNRWGSHFGEQSHGPCGADRQAGPLHGWHRAGARPCS